MMMGFDIALAITYFSGGLIISSTFFIIHLICTINPYHRASIPLITSVIGVLAGVFLITPSLDSNSIFSLREAVSNSVIVIISILPIILAFFTYNFFKISFKKSDPNHLEIIK